MDEVLESLTGFVEGIQPEDLDATLTHDIKRRVVDSVGCMLGAINAPPSVIARRMAGRVSGGPEATVMGLEQKSTLEMAVFANTVMVRYLDFNDGLTRTKTGNPMHASDMIPAQLAAAEVVGCDGMTLLASIAVAYEVGASMCGVNRSWSRSWDSTTFQAIGTALAAGKLLGLTRDQLGHAAAIAAISHIQTHARSVGQLSMWKGCAAAESGRNGIFSALLAQEGITGPETPFVGEAGYMDLIMEERFTLDLNLPYDKTWAIQLSNFKLFPANMNSQALIELILSLRNQTPVAEIENVHVETFLAAYNETGKESDKWDPKTRETADHSTAYLLAAALVDGTVNLDSFEESRFTDPALRALMNRITVAENKGFTDRFPDELNQHITIRLRSGTIVEGHTTHGYGSHLNPPTDDSLNEKFDDLGRRSTQDPGLCNEIRDMLWNLDLVEDLSSVCEIVGRIRAR